jgi:DNA-binding Lrp family transcriptional regulator
LPKAFILLNVDSGYEDIIIKQLRDLDIVKEAFVSYGTYDIIIKISAETMDEVKKSVTHKIRSLDHVRSTLTLIMV